MNGDLFQYALLPISCATDTAEWMVDDNHTNYQTVDTLDFPENLLEQVFALYENSYRAYKDKVPKQLISDAYGLLKYNRWILFYDDADPDKKIVCFNKLK